MVMQLVRTTLRIKTNLKKAAEKKAVEENRSLQDIFNHALEDYLDKKAWGKAKEIIFKTHDLGKPLDKLRRSDYYAEPNAK